MIEIEDDLDWLINMVSDLTNRVLQLENDIYNMQRANDELRRRVSDLESSKRIPPF